MRACNLTAGCGSDSLRIVGGAGEVVETGLSNGRSN